MLPASGEQLLSEAGAAREGAVGSAPDTENRFFWRSSRLSGKPMSEMRAGRFPPACSVWYAHRMGAAGDQAKSCTPSSLALRLSSSVMSGSSYTLIAPLPSRATYLQSGQWAHACLSREKACTMRGGKVSACGTSTNPISPERSGTTLWFRNLRRGLRVGLPGRALAWA